MSNTALTWIHVVLDRSGSMASVRDDTIGGFNAFLAEQKKQPSGALFTLAQFDNEYELVHDHVAIADVPDLTVGTFVPRGGTALLDAVGKTIEAARAKIAAMPAGFKPGKVIFVILTDGGENSSQKFNKGQIAEMIGSARAVDKWEFAFVGANLDAFAEARAMNIPVGNVMGYTSSKIGTRLAMANVSRGLVSYRSSDAPQTSCLFTQESVIGSGPDAPIVSSTTK